jgi:uncharacterized protein YfaS (alpha-2-macroglobulin family)
MRNYLALALVMVLAAPLVAGEVVITNDTGGYDIWYVHISAETDTEWGGDWLGDTEIISSGSTKRFSLPDGVYDIRLVDEDGDEYIQWGVPVNGTYRWNVTLSDIGEATVGGGASMGEGAPVTIYNDLGNYTVYYVRCSRSSNSSWGEDRLDSEFIVPGDDFTFYVSPGTYDIQLEDEDGDTYTRMGVDVGPDGYYWAVNLGDLD